MVNVTAVTPCQTEEVLREEVLSGGTRHSRRDPTQQVDKIRGVMAAESDGFDHGAIPRIVVTFLTARPT
jgi:hypothetical protein